ncbi:MAG: hypothetical protein AAF548_16890 [Actinomycetota bacterium]
MRRLPALASVLLTLALVAASCGDDSGDADVAETTSTAAAAETTTTTEAPETTSTTTTTTTEAPPSVTGADFAAVGPYPVGVTTRTLPTGNAVEIWYPAGDDATGQTDTYAVRDFTPDAMRALVPEELNDRFTVDAGRDASLADDGQYPLVIFSHGSTSFRFQSTSLTHHLASWGMVVASADHPSRSLPGLLGRPDDAPSSDADVAAVRALLRTDDTLGPVIDHDRVGIAGHSAGGGTALRVAADGEMLGYVSYASGAFDDAPLPDVPSLFMSGLIDTIVEPGRTLAAYEAAPAPRWLMEFADSGHLAFSDLCVVGDGDANLITLAEAAGLSDFLDDGLRRLGSDGCDPPNRPVEEIWPGMHQATTGFFRWIFGFDEEPLGLDGLPVDGVSISTSF